MSRPQLRCGSGRSPQISWLPAAIAAHELGHRITKQPIPVQADPSIIGLYLCHVYCIYLLQQASENIIDLRPCRHALGVNLKQSRKAFVTKPNKCAVLSDGRVFMHAYPDMLLWSAVEVVPVDSGFTQLPLPRAGRIEDGKNGLDRLVRGIPDDGHRQVPEFVMREQMVAKLGARAATSV
jgi:hypothetical protein